MATEGLKQKLNPKEAKRGSVISPDVTDPLCITLGLLIKQVKMLVARQRQVVTLRHFRT